MTETAQSRTDTTVREFSRDRRTHRFGADEYEHASLVVRVTSAIATVEGCGIDELDPIGRIVDPEALNELFRVDHEASITFPYGGYDVVAHASGAIDLTPRGR